jgi:predicted PurR-regulated permease PerM
MVKWLSTFLLIWFIYYVRKVFPPFIVGGIIAYLLLPLVQQISISFKVNKTVATTILYLNLLVLCTIVGWVGLPSVIDQFTSMATNREEIITNSVRQAATTFGWDIDVDTTAQQVLSSIEHTFGKPEELAHIGELLSRWLLAILVCVVTSIYFIVDSQRVAAFFLRFVPEHRRTDVLILSEKMNRMLSRYVRGQLVLIAVMSTVAWLFLHYAIGMKYALPVAILSGFLEIIPVLGPIIATSIAAFVGFSQYNFTIALGIVGFYTLARWMEDYLVVPKIIGHAVELHPLVVIFAVLCGEVMAGALGMLIAIPVAASMKLIFDFMMESSGSAKVTPAEVVEKPSEPT